jgi:hypothetical protein
MSMSMTTTMNPQVTLPAIGSLILVRLLAAGEKGETRSRIKKDLEPLLAHRWSGAGLADVLDRTAAGLETAGLLAPLPGKTRKAAAKLVLTAEGRRRGLGFLGVEQLRPKTTWGVLRKTYLPASVLGLPAAGEAAFKALASDPGFKALLLKRQYGLPTTAEIPKLDEAIDALAWKLIGFEGMARKFDVKTVKAAVLYRALGGGHALFDGRAPDFKKVASRLLAHRTGARRDEARELRDAVLRDWIDRQDGGVLGIGQEPPDLPAFAQRVKAAARACPTGRYGDNKVFIAHVWKMLQSDPDFTGMDLAAFKNLLAQANNARLLDLGRADLVQAMNPDDVSRSEVHYLNATFHFVRI